MGEILEQCCPVNLVAAELTNYAESLFKCVIFWQEQLFLKNLQYSKSHSENDDVAFDKEHIPHTNLGFILQFTDKKYHEPLEYFLAHEHRQFRPLLQMLAKQR